MLENKTSSPQLSVKSCWINGIDHVRTTPNLSILSFSGSGVSWYSEYHRCNWNYGYPHEEPLRQLSQGLEPYLQDFRSKDSPKCTSSACLRHSTYRIQRKSVMKPLCTSFWWKGLKSHCIQHKDLLICDESIYLQLTVLFHFPSLIHGYLKAFAFASLPIS